MYEMPRQLSHRNSGHALFNAARHGAAFAWKHRNTAWKLGQQAARSVKHWTHRKPPPYHHHKNASEGAGSNLAADDLHSGKTVTSAKLKPLGKVKIAKGNKEEYGHFQYIQQNAMVIQQGSGKQLFYNISNDLSVTQVYQQASGAFVQDPSPSEYNLSLMRFDPNDKSTGDAGGVITTTGANFFSGRLYVKSIVYEIQFSNSQNAASDLILYIMTPKRQVIGFGQVNTAAYTGGQGAVQVMDADVANVANGYLTQAAQASDINGVQTAPVAGAMSSLLTHGFSPFSVKPVRDNLKQLYRKEFSLVGGGIRKFKITVPVHKMFHEETLKGMLTANAGAIPGATLSLVVCVRGSPALVFDAGVLNTNINQSVSTTPSIIACTTVKKITCSFIPIHSSHEENYAARTFRGLGPTTGNTTKESIVNMTDVAANILTPV